MKFNYKGFGLVAAAAVLTLSIVACHGQSAGSPGYMPTSTAALPASQAGSGIDPAAKKGKITSQSCPHHVKMVVAGIVDCQFHEKGYKNGTFTIQNDESGIVLISPSSGTRSTTFTITGLVAGTGYFLVQDTNDNQYRVAVTVTP